MSRPGKFAKSSRIKQLRQFNRRKQQQGGNTIPWEQVPDFLLGRYHLTQGAQVTPLVDATMQRFFSEWLTTAQAAGPQQVQWSLTALTPPTLKRIGNQVPWQFYAVLATQFVQWQRFFRKEGPAVPITPRRQIIDPLAAPAITQMIAQQLAVNLLTVMATPITNQQLMQLVASFLSNQQIKWSAVATLFGPLGFAVTAPEGSPAYRWLNDLQALTVSDFED